MCAGTSTGGCVSSRASTVRRRSPGRKAISRSRSPSDGHSDNVLNRDGLLWDLRRGDADDDRTSPHGRGWRALIVSSALEFNYLTASLAFLLLIILPALLLGLAPALLAEFGRGQLKTAALVFERPIRAIVLLAVSIGIAFWIARPLVSRANDFFWHLHYTLVCPIFVALREFISAGVERLPGRTTTPELLDRTRRLGTVLAALVFAGVG